MYIELLSELKGPKFNIWKDFLSEAALEADTRVTQTALLWDEDELIATGSRQENILKCIAVKKGRQGEDLTATVLTALRKEAFAEGYRHLFLYTKPENKDMFSSLFFYPVAQTDTVLLMESRKNGINDFLALMPQKASGGNIGAIVMNCNPFTKGHRYLAEAAAKSCDHLYVFVVSENKSLFSAEDRLKMAELGTADLPNVTVLSTGPYLVSAATFPTYFLKNREDAPNVQCMLDIEIFTKYFVPKFSVTHRYVGTEPLSPMTDKYNIALKEQLPKKNIILEEIPRLCINDTPISASAVRSLIGKGDFEKLRELLPDTTFNYLIENDLIRRS